MNPIVAPVAKLLNILTLLVDAGIVVFLAGALVATFSKPFKKWREGILKTIAHSCRLMAFIVALTAMSGSLFFSEVAKYTPCILCWWQRIFMYPQTLLIGLGIVKNDKQIADYARGMSLVGMVIAGYHYYIQLGGNKFIPCSTVGYSVDCAQRFTMEFGYITIPMMSLTAFTAIFLLMTVFKRWAK